jgi:hypothetical protein
MSKHLAYNSSIILSFFTNSKQTEERNILLQEHYQVHCKKSSYIKTCSYFEANNGKGFSHCHLSFENDTFQGTTSQFLDILPWRKVILALQQWKLQARSYSHQF